MVSPIKGTGIWLEIKTCYQNGEGTLHELAERFQVGKKAVEMRCYREGWKREMKEICRSVKENVVALATNEATRWVSETIKRSYRYRKDIDSARNQCGTDSSGNPLLEPSDLKDFSAVENTVDQMARRSLGLTDKVDLTTGGKDLGSSFISALEKIRADASRPKLTDTDLKNVLNAEIVD